jgi:hypothetical protein
MFAGTTEEQTHMAYKIVRTRVFCIVYRITVNILMHCAFEPEAQAKSLIRHIPL